MPRERDAGSGKYVESYPEEQFIDALRANDDMAGTQDVAEYVGCSYDLAYQKLRGLSETDAVVSKRVANARLWMLTEDGETA